MKLHFSTIIIPAIILSVNIDAQGFERDILKKYLQSSGSAEAFKASDDWFPYPDYHDRAGWKALFGADSAAVVSKGIKLLGYKWQYIPATAYLAFERTGDRNAMETIERSNRNAYNVFLFAELAEGKGRFIDRLIDGVYLAAQQPSLGRKPSPYKTHIRSGCPAKE